MGIELIQSVAPTLYPVTLEEVSLHCRITDHTEDELLQKYIIAATRYVERQLDRQLVVATWVLKLDDFPADSIIELPKPPLNSVVTPFITYVDMDGTTQTLAAAYYTVDTYCEPGRVYLNYNYTWPTTRGHYNDVAITFKAGYGAAACTAAASVAAVPESAKQLIKLLVGHWYENREPVLIDQSPTNIPLAVEALFASEDWGSYV